VATEVGPGSTDVAPGLAKPPAGRRPAQPRAPAKVPPSRWRMVGDGPTPARVVLARLVPPSASMRVQASTTCAPTPPPPDRRRRATLPTAAPPAPWPPPGAR